MISRSTKLHFGVAVPAKIVDDTTVGDVIVPEGVTVTLTCNATGVPSPVVTWKRRYLKESLKCNLAPSGDGQGKRHSIYK